MPVNERSWIAVIGDRIAGFEPHDTIESSIEHASNPFSFAAPRARWLATDDLEADADGLLDGTAGVWCAPGGPFRSMEGALRGIAWARTRGVPFIGTSAGLQHAVVEFARNVLGHPAAAHAEYGRDGELFIDELLCSLVGQTMEVDVVDDELRRIYGTTRSTEKYYCRFGVNPRWQAQLHDAGLRIAGVDARGSRRPRDATRRSSVLCSDAVRTADIVHDDASSSADHWVPQRGGDGKGCCLKKSQIVCEALICFVVSPSCGGENAEPGHVWPPPSMM